MRIIHFDFKASSAFFEFALEVAIPAEQLRHVYTVGERAAQPVRLEVTA